MQDNRMHLTPRLRTIMEQVPNGARLADIGTDHALIPVALLRRKRIVSVIASDIRPGPLESAARTARQFGVEQQVVLRLGAGLQIVAPEEVDTIVIAGMGGETIMKILEDDPWAMEGNHLLLLQPMTAQAQLRQYLGKQGCDIEKESLCREGRRMYTVMTVRGGGSRMWHTLSGSCVSEALLRDPLAHDYLTKKLDREESICAALASAKHQKPSQLQLHCANVSVLTEALETLNKKRK